MVLKRWLTRSGLLAAAAAGATAAVLATGSSGQTAGGQVVMQTFTHEDVVTYTIPPPETVTQTVTVTQAGTTSAPPPPPTTTASGAVLYTRDSTNDDFTNCDAAYGTISRGELGDIFHMTQSSAGTLSRCTWLDNQFTHMNDYYDYDVTFRFDAYTQADSNHNGVSYMRNHPAPDTLEAGCSQPGNGMNHAIRFGVDSATSPDSWEMFIQGGLDPWPQDLTSTHLHFGTVTTGQNITLRFKVHPDWQHGSVTVWKAGAVIYDNPDRPVGFHYDCSAKSSTTDTTLNAGANDISNSYLHQQHGIYRHSSGQWQLTSSGFRFSCSQATPCP